MLAFSRRLAVVVVAALALTACNKGGPGGSAEGDMSLGKADSKVTVIEYASVTCPHCARFNNDVFPAFKAKYIDTNLIHYTFREFPTPPLSVASAGFLVARCVAKTGGPEKYFAVTDAIFHRQEEVVAQARTSLLLIAKSAGLTEAQFEACVADEDALKALNNRVKGYADKENISSTPTFIINGKKLEGEVTLGQLDAEIQPLLAK